MDNATDTPLSDALEAGPDELSGALDLLLASPHLRPSLRAELEELKRLHSTLSRLFAELRIDLAGRARVLPGPIRTPAPQDRDSALEERGRGPLSRRGALSPSLRARLVTKTPPTAER